MKKDIFNNKISNDYKNYVKFILIFTSILCILLGILFLMIAIFYNKIDYFAKIFLYIISVVSILIGIIYPIITICLIKIYPKNKNITKLFLKEEIFVEDKLN
ncbi:MAG: hypothetical protein E7359_00370 [Clostridiales bacterium]|nr:hypothetical protein [Clostridiales bacterium]